jgi:hypothetical protein
MDDDDTRRPCPVQMITDVGESDGPQLYSSACPVNVVCDPLIGVQVDGMMILLSMTIPVTPEPTIAADVLRDEKSPPLIVR